MDTNRDYATVKYDGSGDALWVSNYNFSGNGPDEAYALAMDSTGNVVVTGYSAGGIGPRDDYATLMYDSSGNQVWANRWNGLQYDQAYDVAADSAGNFYVTGESGANITGNDFATVKYNNAGDELWVARYNDMGRAWDRPNAIAVDGSGNVYVTGYSFVSGVQPDYVTVKYDGAGNELWASKYDGPASLNDQATDIEVDSMGNVFVTGHSSGGTTGNDCATIKYDSDGNEDWVRRIETSGADECHALVTDPAGNVYVVGRNNGTYLTIKYDGSGNTVWSSNYDLPAKADIPRDIVLAPSGNVYVTGMSGSFNEYDYATVKYDHLGNEIWVRRYDGPAMDDDMAFAITIDGSENVYVTGRSEGVGTDYDFATVAYDTHGNLLWVERLNGSGTVPTMPGTWLQIHQGTSMSLGLLSAANRPATTLW